MIAPIILLVSAVFILFSDSTLVYRITCAAEILFIMLASYYNLKHLMVHDVEFGIIGSIRGYNLIALLLELFYTAEIAFDAFDLITVKSVVYAFMSICLLIIIPILKRGGEKWKI